MKVTGIVRRIDELGRIVIPKEIRRTLCLREGDPMEMFVDDGDVVLRRFDYGERTANLIQRIIQQVRDSADEWEIPRDSANKIVSLLEDAVVVADSVKGKRP